MIVENEEQLQQRFNKFCAATVGYQVGEGCADGAYMSVAEGGHQRFVCDIDHYNPWDNPEQLMPVADILMKNEPFPNAAPMMVAQGAFLGLRHYVIGCMENEEKDLEFAQSPWYDTTTDTMHDPGEAQCHVNELPKAIQAVDNTNIYYHAARILTITNHRGYENFYVDGGGVYHLTTASFDFLLRTKGDTEEVEPFSDRPNGLAQLFAIESYLRNPSHCLDLWEEISEADPSIVQEVTLNAIHQHKKMIVRKCLETLAGAYKKPEEKFNELCLEIRRKLDRGWFGIDKVIFDPYNNIKELSRIVEVVVTVSDQPMVIQKPFSGELDMLVEMREYVETYSDERYLPELYEESL